MKRTAFLLAMLLGVWPAAAQTVQDVERREAELLAVWEKMPLTLRKAAFVTEKAPIYGAYSERPSATFKKGETILAYLEPMGYGWKREGDRYLLGISLDLLLKTKDGKILGGQERFLNYQQASRYRLRELMLNVTLTLGGTPAGEYQAEFVVHDLTGKSGSVTLPFTIVD